MLTAILICCTVHLLLSSTMTSKCKLFHKLSHCYMFRHYCVIIRKLEISTLQSYTSISNAAVGNTINNKLFHTIFTQDLTTA